MGVRRWPSQRTSAAFSSTSWSRYRSRPVFVRRFVSARVDTCCTRCDCAALSRATTWQRISTNMARAFIFPGQGSQAVGMGRALAESFPQAKAVFDEVDEALGQSLSTLMFEGPTEELTLTANAQPALMAASLAVVRRAPGDTRPRSRSRRGGGSRPLARRIHGARRRRDVHDLRYRPAPAHSRRGDAGRGRRRGQGPWPP